MNEKIKRFMEFNRRKKARAYAVVFDSPQGREVLYDLYERCGMGKTTHQATPHDSAFAEGSRAVFLHILNTLHMDAPRVIDIADDATQRHAAEARRYREEGDAA